MPQDEAKLRALQEKCHAGQLPRADSEKSMSNGQQAVHRLAAVLGERLVQHSFVTRRNLLLQTTAALALTPMPAYSMHTRDGASRPVSVRHSMHLGRSRVCQMRKGEQVGLQDLLCFLEKAIAGPAVRAAVTSAYSIMLPPCRHS